MLSLTKATDAAGFAKLQGAAAASSRTFRDAASSTRMFEVQQLRLNSATDDYVKKLRAQKAGFREIARSRKIAMAAYKEQLAMENMTIRQGVGGRSNKGMYDVIIPKQASAELDTAGKRLAFFNQEIKSGAHQMVNWGKNTQWAGRQLMVGFTMPIAAFGAVAGVMAYKVDQELTRIAKVIDTTATDSAGIEKELAQVRVEGLRTATKAAKEYGSAVTDTLEVQAELAATGLVGGELQKATGEVMRIARLGEIENKVAIDSTIALQTVFSDTIKNANDLSDAFNYMNSIENATSLSTADFATAIPVASASVKSFGGDVKELGILLTAMRENGIQAAQGANALKATMQRLGRPSKQIREEWQALTGTDITQLVDSSDGLIDVFTKINEATEGIDDNARRKAFAGLFGSYQVSKMIALTKGMGDLRDGVGQVSRAYEISNQSAESWANTAESEVERYKNSVSGMWDTAFQSMKIELAEVGEPFVVLATQVVRFVGGILKAFNDMPNIAKLFIASGIAVTALSGGILMLAGLFANLTGNLIKGAANLANFALRMELVDKDTRAARLATEMSTASYLEQASAVDMLTAQINALTAAQRESNLEMLRNDPAMITALPHGASYEQAMDMQSSEAQRKQVLGSMMEPSDNGMMIFRREGLEISKEEAELYSRQVVDGERMAVMKDAELDAAKKGAAIDADREASRKRTTKMAAVGATVMAVEAASMATLMFSSNETAQNVAQIAMVAGIAAPAFAAMSPVVKGIGSKLKEVSTATGEAVKKAGLLGGGYKAGLVSLVKMINPVGLLVTGLTIAGGVIYKMWRSHQNKIKEAIADQKTLNNLAKDYANEMGRTWKDYERLRLNGPNGIDTQVEREGFTKDRTYFSESAAGKKAVEAYNDLATVTSKANTEQQMFIDAQVNMGMTAERAGTLVTAFMIEAGYSATEANNRAKELLSTLGKIEGTQDWAKIMGDQRTSLKSKAIDIKEDRFLRTDLQYDPKEAERVAKDSADMIVGSFNQALSEAKNTEDAKVVMAQFVSTAMVGWDEAWNKFIAGNPERLDKLRELGVTNAQELSAYMDTLTSVQKMQLGTVELGMGDDDRQGFVRATDSAGRIEAALMKAYGTSNNLGDSLSNINELTKSAAVNAATMDFDEAKEAVRALQARMMSLDKVSGMGLGGWDEDARAAAEETARVQINAFNASKGFRQGATYTQALAYWMDEAVDHSSDVNSEASRLPGIVSSAASRVRTLAGAFAALGKQGFVDAAKESMESVQSTMADSWRKALDDRQQAASDSLSDQQSAEADALSNRLDREGDALDNAWDAKRKGLEKYWDARIDGIDKAIEREEKAEEKRVKMFDAEIARINRLADMANTNIDFNVALNEGNLDEAAKIANTASAKDAEFIFNREKDRGADKSKKRVERLGGRKERLEEGKDKAMEAFDKRAEAAKSYFDNYRKMEEESLATTQENQQKALDATQERQKESLDETLKTFLSWTPKNKKELEKHAADLGLSMKEFGQTVLKPMSIKWADWFRQNFSKGIIDSANKSASDEAWSNLGKEAKKKILIELGFKTEKDFDNFIRTGQMGANTGDATPRGFGSKTKLGGTKPTDSRHGGGWIGGKGTNSRKGVADNYRGQHPTERLVNTRLGEFVMNEDAASKYGSTLEAMNSGKNVGGEYGPGGFMAGVLMQSMLKGVGKSLARQKDSAQSAAAMGSMSPIGAASSGFSASGFSPGQGGWRKPSVPGLGWTNTHDYRAGTGTPIYAISDGVITDSRAITSGGSPGNGSTTPSGVPYRSYGETIGMRAADGSLFRYAHLSARYVGAGQPVTGGSLIGRTGNTGNSSGPHLHMDVNGNYNASGYLASRGVSLRKGAEMVKFDNTMANLHRGESVLTKNLTSKMHEGVDRFANGGDSAYNVTVNINGYDGDKKALAREVITIVKRESARAPQSRTIG